MEAEPGQRQYRSMNSHNPNPDDGQQSATPSDGQPGPRNQHRPGDPADAGRLAFRRAASSAVGTMIQSQA